MLHGAGPMSAGRPAVYPHQTPIVVLGHPHAGGGGATSHLAGAVSALRKPGAPGVVWQQGGVWGAGGLTPSLGNHVNPRLVEHVTGWPTDFLERQVGVCRVFPAYFNNNNRFMFCFGVRRHHQRPEV